MKSNDFCDRKETLAAPAGAMRKLGVALPRTAAERLASLSER